MINDKNIDELIERALQEEQALPAGFSDRLINQLDHWEARERQAKSKRMRMLFLTVASVAASLLFAFYYMPSLTLYEKAEYGLADTYTNPEEAAIAAGEALALLSTNLNKGIDQATNSTNNMRDIESIATNKLIIQ